MHHILSLLLFSLITTFCAAAFTGRIVDCDGNRIEGALAVGLTPDTVYVASAVTDSIGVFHLPNNMAIKLIRIKSIGQKETFIHADSTALGTITLQPGDATLAEVEVTPDIFSQDGDKLTYRLTKKQLDKYARLSMALNEIPGMVIFRNNMAMFQGSSNLLFLIDGQKASLDEIAAMSKDDLAKIEINQVPPARYATSQVTAVINLLTKSGLHGGNVAINLTDALWRIDGSNNISAIYNRGRSRFNLQYNNNLRHYTRKRTDDYLAYEIDGMKYGKEKIGMPSKENIDYHAVAAQYMFRKPQNIQFNASFDYGNNRTDSHDRQQVNYFSGEQYEGLNRLRTTYDRYAGSLYLDKNFANGHTFTVTAATSHYNTKYLSHLSESSPDGISALESRSSYKGSTSIYAIQAYYTFPIKNTVFETGLYDSYSNGKTTNTDNPTDNHTNLAFAYAQWSGSKKTGEKYSQIYWMAYLSATGNYSRTTTSAGTTESYNNWTPGAYLSFGYVPDDNNGNTQMRLLFARNTTNPSLGQLGETPQWLDAKLVYHGNSHLKPFATNQLCFFIYSSLWQRLAVSLTAFYENSPHTIAETFTRSDDVVIQTFENLRKYQKVYGSLQLTLNITRNGSLRFTTLLNASRSWGSGSSYNWKGYTFQWMPGLFFNTGKWSASAQYQYPGKVMEGHLIRPRAQSLRLSAGYSPIRNLDISIEWRQPFNMQFRESEKSVKEAIVSTEHITTAADWHNMVSLSVFYNFNFGRRHDNSRRKINLDPSDSGILSK